MQLKSLQKGRETHGFNSGYNEFIVRTHRGRCTVTIKKESGAGNSRQMSTCESRGPQTSWWPGLPEAIEPAALAEGDAAVVELISNGITMYFKKHIQRITHNINS